MFDIRLEENFKLFLSGPSIYGKTYFISTLLENLSSFAKQTPTKIIFIYTVWLTKFDEMQGMVNVFIKDYSNYSNYSKLPAHLGQGPTDDDSHHLIRHTVPCLMTGCVLHASRQVRTRDFF